MRFQVTSKLIRPNSWITQTVRQRTPNCRARNGESTSAESAHNNTVGWKTREFACPYITGEWPGIEAVTESNSLLTVTLSAKPSKQLHQTWHVQPPSPTSRQHPTATDACHLPASNHHSVHTPAHIPMQQYFTQHAVNVDLYSA